MHALFHLSFVVILLWLGATQLERFASMQNKTVAMAARLDWKPHWKPHNSSTHIEEFITLQKNVDQSV